MPTARRTESKSSRADCEKRNTCFTKKSVDGMEYMSFTLFAVTESFRQHADNCRKPQLAFPLRHVDCVRRPVLRPVPRPSPPIYTASGAKERKAWIPAARFPRRKTASDSGTIDGSRTGRNRAARTERQPQVDKRLVQTGRRTEMDATDSYVFSHCICVGTKAA